MGILIEWIIGRTGWSEKIARLAATAALVVLLVGACAGLLAAYNHHIIAAHNAKVLQRVQPANDQAGAERSTDTIVTTRHEQELHDAVQAQPDQPIAATSHALACQRLHDAGRDPPACR